MASTILIRRAQLEDAAVLTELSASTFVETFGSHYPPEDLDTYLTHTYTVEAYAALLDSADHQAWLAMDEDTAIGYLLAGPCSLPHPKVGDGDGEIKRFYVRGTHQSAGVGTQLFEVALEWLLHRGPRTLWLGVWDLNPGAQRFYRRYGFDRAGDYLFEVGNTRDFELIFMRPAAPFVTTSSR